MSWAILTAHLGASPAVRTHRIANTARLRASAYHHAALAIIAQQSNEELL